MKHGINNMSFKKEIKPLYMIQRKMVNEINDLELLGVYTYLMLVYDEGIPPPAETIANRMAHHFDISEEYILKKLRCYFDLFDEVNL